MALAHLKDPRSVVPQSIMPNYAFLADTELDMRDLADYMRASQMVGVPYSDDDIAKSAPTIRAQVTPDSPEARRSRQALSEGAGAQV